MKRILGGCNCNSSCAYGQGNIGTERREARLTESFQQGKYHKSRPLENPTYPPLVTHSEEWRLSLPSKNDSICVQAKLTKM